MDEGGNLFSFPDFNYFVWQLEEEGSVFVNCMNVVSSGGFLRHTFLSCDMTNNMTVIYL